jgi:transposase-like protein
VHLGALGVDAEGRKHPLGLWEGTTENKGVCQAQLRNLIGRRLSVETAKLFVIDGGKGSACAIVATFGEQALIQRCRVHKRHNVLDHLPQSGRTSIGRRLDRAWAQPDT